MTSIYLSETLAALGKKPENSPADVRASEGQAIEGPWTEVATALRGELSASAIPMEDYLERGGWPELVGIDVRGVCDRGKQIDVLLTLRFIEHTPAACPSSSKPETRIAYMKAVIDRTTAQAVLADDS